MTFKKNIPTSYWIVFLVFVAAALFVSGKLQEIVFKMQGKTGTELVMTCHSQYDFSIMHPRMWHPQLYGGAGLHGVSDMKLLITNGWRGPMILVYYHPSRKPTLSQALNWQNARINVSPMEITETKDIIVDTDIHAIVTVYHKYNYIYEAITFVRNDGMFTFLFKGSENHYHKYRKIFENMVISFGPCNDNSP